MKPHSVAMVAACPFPANWGTPGAIREMSAALAALGHQVHIVTYPLGEDLSVGGARVWRPRYWHRSSRLHSGPSYEKPLLDLLLLVKLCRVIRRERISIIHAHNYEGALIGILAKFITRRPLVYHAVSLMSDELPSYDFIKPAFLARGVARLLDWLVPKFPNQFIAVTPALKAALIKRGVPEQRIAFIPCGVRAARFNEGDPRWVRERYELGDRPVVMYTGINSRFQRIDYLLRSFDLVLKAEPGTVLMVVSPLENDPDLARNRALAVSLGVGDSIIWVEGQTLAELPDYLSAALVAVIPRPDVPGHPIKLLNYMAASRPIVCFAGAAKGVRHMREALVAPDHDWRQFASEIVTLLHNPELAKRLGTEARRMVLAQFDWHDLCQDIEAVYSAMVDVRPVFQWSRTKRQARTSFSP